MYALDCHAFSTHHLHAMPNDDCQGEDAAALGIESLHSPDAVQRQAHAATSSIEAVETEETLREGQPASIHFVLLSIFVVVGVGQGEDGGDVRQRDLAVG